jgi:site-specific recombinase XerD
MATATAMVPSSTLTVAQFQYLADVPPEIEWFANLTNANTRRAYQQDLADFIAFAGLRQPAQFRDVTRAHVIAWREQLVGQGLANDTIQRKLAALLIPSDFVVHRFRPPMEEAMRRLWSQVG